MPESAETRQILDAIALLSVQMAHLTSVVDAMNSDLRQHRRDSETRTTNLDLAFRDELQQVRAVVQVLSPKLDAVAATQTEARDHAEELALLVEATNARADAIKAEVETLKPKLDDVRSKQEELIAKRAEPPVQ